MAVTRQRRVRGSDVFAAIGDPTRRKILDMLSHNSMPVGEISERFRVSRPAISQHLRVLREASLVRARRCGREQIYSLRPEPLREAYVWIEHYQQFWNEKLSALGKYLDGVSGGSE
jgi:DNA-binding transcriptional ArsR family regulator